MTPLSFDTWIELGLKGTAVLGLAAATCCAMRQSSAASRHLVWASAIAAVLALPALSLLVPSVPLPLGGVERLTTAASSVTAFAPASVAARPVSPPTVQPHHGPRTTASVPSRQSTQPAHAPVVVSRAELLFAVWAFGALALLVRLAVALVGAHRLVRSAEPIDDEQWHDGARGGGRGSRASNGCRCCSGRRRCRCR